MVSVSDESEEAILEERSRGEGGRVDPLDRRTEREQLVI